MRILSYKLFESYNKKNLLLEEFVPAGNASWPSNWKEMPEWKKLQDLGFIETTTDRQARLNTIMLKNTRINYMYPAGVVLQASGYIRDKGVSSGFITNKYTDLSDMLNYLITKYTKEVERNSVSERTGPLTAEQIKAINTFTQAPWKWNPQTESVDVSGKVTVVRMPFDSSIDEEILGSFKFGIVKGDFVLDCANFKINTLENFAPVYVGKDIILLGVGLKNMKGFPQTIKGGNITIKGTPDSLKGIPMEAKELSTAYFIARPWNIKNALVILGEGGVDVDDKRADGEVIRRHWNDNPTRSRISSQLVSTVLTDDIVDEYFTKNPLNLHFLDAYPDIKSEVLKRTGMRDLSNIGRILHLGLF
jgi:hypothetical protein